MTMELEGNLSLERSHTRRWVSIVAVIIPVAAIVLLAAWFVRVYVAPATVLIPNPPMTVAEPPEPPSSSVRAQIEAPQPPTVMAEPAEPAGERTSRLRAADVCDAGGCAAGGWQRDAGLRRSGPGRLTRTIDHGGRDGSDRTGRADRRSCSAAPGQAARPRRAARRCDTTAAAEAGGDRAPPEDIPAVDRHGIH